MFHDLPGFLFTGAFSLPGYLAFAADPGLAMLVFVFLLLAGCLAALGDHEAPFRTAGERPAPAPRRR